MVGCGLRAVGCGLQRCGVGGSGSPQGLRCTRYLGTKKLRFRSGTKTHSKYTVFAPGMCDGTGTSKDGSSSSFKNPSQDASDGRPTPALTARRQTSTDDLQRRGRQITEKNGIETDQRQNNERHLLNLKGSPMDRCRQVFYPHKHVFPPPEGRALTSQPNRQDFGQAKEGPSLSHLADARSDWRGLLASPSLHPPPALPLPCCSLMFREDQRRRRVAATSDGKRILCIDTRRLRPLGAQQPNFGSGG